MGLKTERKIVKVAGSFKEVVTVKDEAGKVLHKIINPLMITFRLKDVLQVIVGASILAIPVAFTEETWKLGESLPLLNIILLMALSLTFISLFIYYNYYREHLKEHWEEFTKRALSTYMIAFLVVALILTIIQMAPWSTDLLLAFKRIVLVAFPASMSGAVADTIK